MFGRCYCQYLFSHILLFGRCYCHLLVFVVDAIPPVLCHVWLNDMRADVIAIHFCDWCNYHILVLIFVTDVIVTCWYWSLWLMLLSHLMLVCYLADVTPYGVTPPPLVAIIINYAIIKLISEYGQESVRFLRQWEKLEMKMADFQNHRRFTLRCLSKGLIPVSIKLKTTVKTPKGIYIVRKAARMLMNELDQ